MNISSRLGGEAVLSNRMVATGRATESANVAMAKLALSVAPSERPRDTSFPGHIHFPATLPCSYQQPLIMGADLSRPEFQKFTHLSLGEAVKDEEFEDLVASLVQTLPPETKQALGSLVLGNHSASNPSQKESQAAELPSDANGPLSNDDSTSNPSQNGPRITEFPSDASDPLSNDSSTPNPSQNGSQVAELPSDANGPLSNDSSTSNPPQRELRIFKNLKGTRFQCLLRTTPEQLCINPKIRKQYVGWTGDWTLLFTIPTAQLQPQGNTIAHSQPQGDFIIHLQSRGVIGASLGALYNATVLVEQNALIDSIRWRFLMVFYDGLREMVKDTGALAGLVSNSTGIGLKEVKKKMDGWISDGRRWRALAQSLSWGSLFLLPESISNDSWLRLPLNGHNREAAVDKLKLLGIVEKAQCKKVDDLGADKLSADELGVTIKDGLLEPFKDIAKSVCHQTTEAINALKRRQRLVVNENYRSKKARRDIYSTALVVAQGTSLRVEMTRPSDERSHLVDYGSAPQPGLTREREGGMSGPTVDAQVPVTSRSPDPTQGIFPKSSHGGNDARPGAIISPIDPRYDSYANSPVRPIECQQGGPYNHLSPLPAQDPPTLHEFYKGGPYNHLNPLPALDPSALNEFYEGGPYNHLNPLPAWDPSTLDEPYKGGPYNHLNPPPALDPSIPIDQGQHGGLPDTGLTNGALLTSYENSGPAMNSYVDFSSTAFSTGYNNASNPRASANSSTLGVTSSSDFNSVPAFNCA